MTEYIIGQASAGHGTLPERLHDLGQTFKQGLDPGGYANEMKRKANAKMAQEVAGINASIVPPPPTDVIDTANTSALRALRKKQMASTYLGAPPPTPTPPLKPATTLLGGK